MREEAERIAESRRNCKPGSTSPKSEGSDKSPKVAQVAKATRPETPRKSKQIKAPPSLKQVPASFFGYGASVDIVNRIVTDDVVASLFSLIDEKHIQDNVGGATKQRIR